MVNKIIKLLQVSRPVYWLNTAYPFAAGYIISGGNLNLFFAITTFFFLIPYNLLMYGVNDIFDYESDILNPRKGGVEGLKEERSLHPTIAKAILAINLPILLYIFKDLSANALLVLAGLLFFVVAYSLKYLRFKEIPILDSLTSSIHFVGPLVFALAVTNSLQANSYFIILAFLLWGMASHAFGAVQDIIPDREGKISSIATFFGAKLTIRLAIVFYSLASFIILLQPNVYRAIGLLGAIYLWNIKDYINISDKKSGQTNKAWRRFILINPFVGFVITLALIAGHIIKN